MSLLASLLCVASVGLQGDAKPVILGTYRFDGREVTAAVPGAPGPFAEGGRAIKLGEDSYAVSPEGRIFDRYRAHGGWSEIRSGYAAAKAAITPETPQWRVKVFVLPRSEILDLATNGVARTRRSLMEKPEIAHVAESVARFAAMAEAAAGGKLKLAIEYEVDEDAAYQNATQDRKPFDAAFLDWYVRPRINGGLYEAEDRVYRGPFDSVFVVHGGFSGPMPMVDVSNTPVTPISFYHQGQPRGPEALSISLFNGWTGHLAFAARKAGYRVPQLRAIGTASPRIESLNDIGLWPLTPSREEASTATFVSHRGSPESRAYDWSDIADAPLSKLPSLGSAELEGLTGSPSPLASGSAGETSASLDSRFEPGREASAWVSRSRSNRRILFVDAPFAMLFGERLSKRLKPKVLGNSVIEDRLMVTFEIDEVPGDVREAALLETPELQGVAFTDPPATPSNGGEVAASLEPGSSTAASLPLWGEASLKDVDDPERGKVLEMRLWGFIRSGRVTLLGRPSGPPIASAATHPFLSLYVKATHPEPLQIRIESPSGDSKSIALYGVWPKPAELPIETPKEVIQPTADAWSQIVVDLRKLGVAEISAVHLESSPLAGYWASTEAVPPLILLDDIRLTKNAPRGESPLSSMATSPAKMEQAAGAAADSPELQALLKDPDDTVRLNAARAYTRIKSVAAEPGLVDLVRSLDPRISEAACEALAFQNTDGGWAALKRAVEIGPFDFTRAFAAREIGKKKDRNMVSTLSLMLTSRSWQGRMWGAESLGNSMADNQQPVLMAFLHEIDPAVRVAVTKSAKASVDDVSRRLLWSAVNDPSDEVRAWSCLRLIQTGNPKYVPEGLKGVRDDSSGMRKRLLQLFREQPNEAHRPALRMAVTDALPSVRAEALRAFATLPGAVTADEVQNTLNDPDPRVQAALAELRMAKGF